MATMFCCHDRNYFGVLLYLVIQLSHVWRRWRHWNGRITAVSSRAAESRRSVAAAVNHLWATCRVLLLKPTTYDSIGDAIVDTTEVGDQHRSNQHARWWHANHAPHVAHNQRPPLPKKRTLFSLASVILCLCYVMCHAVERPTPCVLLNLIVVFYR